MQGFHQALGGAERMQLQLLLAQAPAELLLNHPFRQLGLLLASPLGRPMVVDPFLRLQRNSFKASLYPGIPPFRRSIESTLPCFQAWRVVCEPGAWPRIHRCQRGFFSGGFFGMSPLRSWTECPPGPRVCRKSPTSCPDPRHSETGAAAASPRPVERRPDLDFQGVAQDS